MTLNYDPDADAQPNEVWDTTFLSDRDVSAQVPINFVPHPGVYVTAACFGNNIYEDDAAENCLSNLLSSQIRRYVIDIYWDTINQRFGLCPVEIPASSTNSSQIATSEGDSSPGSTVSAANSLQSRQATSTSASNRTLTPTSTTITSASATYSIVASSGDTEVFQLGPYRCSNTLTLASVTSVFSDFLERTANTLDAKLLTWVLNLHLAATPANPTSTRTETPASQLPNTTTAVSTYLDNLRDVLYQPTTLLSDRQNLNTSWFRRGEPDQLPLISYYTTYALPNGDTATDDGWPDENYIQVVRGKRLLVGFGDIAPGMSEYNTSMDGDRVYPPGYISAPSNIDLRSDGELSSGCYYNADDFDVNQVNNSWAVAPINTADLSTLGDAADNLTTCGFSQLLNVTLNDTTADVIATPYQDFGNNAIFSWAYGEPENDTSRHVDDSEKFRCALMVSNDVYRGHWRTEFCNQKYRVACREATSPYRWRISGFSVPYASADAACTGNTTFDVPRTGLENAYLYNKIISDSQADKGLPDGVWVNFNSLDVENCWVTTGVNGSCPYYQDADATHSRQILIPTIAALIVLVVTVLTILAKCSANARNSRTRKRGEGGWDYEGVPS